MTGSILDPYVSENIAICGTFPQISRGPNYQPPSMMGHQSFYFILFYFSLVWYFDLEEGKCDFSENFTICGTCPGAAYMLRRAPYSRGLLTGAYYHLQLLTSPFTEM